jgi:hypothetical protein
MILIYLKRLKFFFLLNKIVLELKGLRRFSSTIAPNHIIIGHAFVDDMKKKSEIVVH